jgi:osmoprotectant transport system permease protein
MIEALPYADVVLHNRVNESGCVPDNGLFCPGWATDNWHEFVTPSLQHLVLVAVPILAGFVIALALAIVAHRRRWLMPPILGATGALYTIPSIAFFFLLTPAIGRGRETAIIALTAYTLQIIFRNIFAGLDNVPADAKDAGRGMGLTDGQLLWRVELPLALPEIFAGLRIAVVSTAAIASLAFLVGGGGLGTEIFTGSNTFNTRLIIASVLVMLIAFCFDGLLNLLQRLLTPWRRAASA